MYFKKGNKSFTLLSLLFVFNAHVTFFSFLISVRNQLMKIRPSQ